MTDYTPLSTPVEDGRHTRDQASGNDHHDHTPRNRRTNQTLSWNTLRRWLKREGPHLVFLFAVTYGVLSRSLLNSQLMYNGENISLPLVFTALTIACIIYPVVVAVTNKIFKKTRWVVKICANIGLGFLWQMLLSVAEKTLLSGIP